MSIVLSTKIPEKEDINVIFGTYSLAELISLCFAINTPMLYLIIMGVKGYLLQKN